MNIRIFIIPALALVAWSCSHDAPDPVLTVTVDATEINAGQTVTLTIKHNLDGIAIYNGEEGNNYFNSAAYILAGKTEDDLLNNVYRPVDDSVIPLEYDFSDATVGATTIGSGYIEVVNANSGDNLMGSEAEIVNNPDTGGKMLQITSTHPDWWYQALRVNLNSKIGSNTNLTLRMRFDHDYLEDIYTGAQSADITTFGVVVRLAGKAAGSDEVVFNDNTVWDIYWQPSTSWSEYTVDLSRVVSEWQTGTGLEMETINYAQILFVASGSIGYVGNIYVDYVQFGDYDYVAFDTGETITMNNGPGTATYTHTYNTPGEYTIVVIGTTVGDKVQGASYTNDRVNATGANEYDIKRVIRTIDIKVN
ncbi:MAG: DUF5017 domain-containing protein [Bacteroidales bacterium]|nr:DUF5017 domain-containing protein [Bacteroidales bacterium]